MKTEAFRDRIVSVAGNGFKAAPAGAPFGQTPEHAAQTRMFWKAQFAVWCFLALFGFTARQLTYGDIGFSIVMTLTVDPVGFLLTAAAHVLFLSRRNPVTTIPIVLTMLFFSFLGGFLMTESAERLRTAFFGDVRLGLSQSTLTVFYGAVLVGWSLAYLWLRALIEARAERLRSTEARAEATRAELERLHLQLAPHFLFNALNSVASEIHDRPDAALEMVRRIAAYLRYCLDQSANAICPLADELAAMRAYLRIQELRFEEKLHCRVDVDPSAENVLVPHMILQGLVENAVKHGLKHPGEAIAIGVSVTREDPHTIVITVVNSGTLEISSDRPTIGLANTRQRLQLHYPEGYDLTLRQADDQVIARLTLKGSACRV